MNSPLPNWAAFDGPATYRIVVQGTLALDLSDSLEGMEISRAISDDGVEKSILFGELQDQSALAGVLLSLYDLRVTLKSIEQIPARASSSQLAPENLEGKEQNEEENSK